MLIARLTLTILDRVARRDGHEQGQSLAEYALILALVAVLCVAGLTAFKGGISNTLNGLAAHL